MRTVGTSAGAMRVALLRGVENFTPDLTTCLGGEGITPCLVDSPETILRSLRASLDTWDIIVCPISARFEPGLDFVRAVRRIRESFGGPPDPPVLVLSDTDHLPVTVDLFRRTSGVRYMRFASS